MTAVTPTPPVALPESHVGRGQAVGRYSQPSEGLDGLQVGYSARKLAFMRLHLPELESIWLNPGAATRAIQERLEDEFFNLRHASPACMCWCDGKRHDACEKWRQSVGGYGRVRPGQLDDVGREIGRTTLVHAPMPSAEMMDMGRLTTFVRTQRVISIAAQVRFLNGVAA